MGGGGRRGTILHAAPPGCDAVTLRGDCSGMMSTPYPLAVSAEPGPVNDVVGENFQRQPGHRGQKLRWRPSPGKEPRCARQTSFRPFRIRLHSCYPGNLTDMSSDSERT